MTIHLAFLRWVRIRIKAYGSERRTVLSDPRVLWSPVGYAQLLRCRLRNSLFLLTRNLSVLYTRTLPFIFFVSFLFLFRPTKALLVLRRGSWPDNVLWAIFDLTILYQSFLFYIGCFEAAWACSPWKYVNPTEVMKASLLTMAKSSSRAIVKSF